jgi:hypothetical protein
MKNLADEFIPIVQRCAKCNKIYYAPKQVSMCPCFLGERAWVKQIANIVGMKVAEECLHSTGFQEFIENEYMGFWKTMVRIGEPCRTDFTPIPSETIFRKYFR